MWGVLKGRFTSELAQVDSALDPLKFACQLRKTEDVGVDQQTKRPLYVRLQDWTSEVVIYSMGASQGGVLSPFLFSLYTHRT